MGLVVVMALMGLRASRVFVAWIVEGFGVWRETGWGFGGVG